MRGHELFNADVRVFASRFWGFSPELHPAITFGLDGNRNRLLMLSRPQDLVLFVGTTGFPTDPDEQGRLLGVAQFGRIPVDAMDILERESLPEHSFKNGKYKWPKALAMLRAWRFVEPRPLLVDILQRQLPMYATVGAVQLDAIDRNSVLDLHLADAPVRSSKAIEELNDLQRALKNNEPTKGPNASSWSGEISRDVSGKAQTYALRFGKTDVWKIGWAKDAKARCNEVNRHIPVEALEQDWKLKLVQNWDTGEEAYTMEQRLLSILDSHRTFGERVRCKESSISSAWHRAIMSPKNA